METMDFTALYERAKAVTGHRQLSAYTDVGGVGAAILTKSGHIYVGVNIDTACSMGFCAEHAAAAAMITAGENEIAAVIAVDENGVVVPPCGRCRQMLVQLADGNEEAQVMVEQGVVYTLGQLLPFDWRVAHPHEEG